MDVSDDRSGAGSRLFQELREFVGDADAELRELIRLFNESAAERLADARRALGEHDEKTLLRAAHSLRSMSAGVGAHALSHIAGELEQLVRTQAFSPIARIRVLLERIAAELAWIEQVSPA